MARVVPAREVGLPEGVGRVRISTSRARRGKILAVEHPILGWTPYRQWALLRAMESAVDRIGPLVAVAFVGLTIFYKGLADAGENLFDFIRKVTPTPDQPVPFGFSSFEAYVQTLAQGLVLTPFGVIAQAFFPLPPAAVGGPERSLSSEALKWFWAAVAAAATVTIGRKVL